MKKNKPDAFVVTKDDGSWDLIGAGVMEKYAIKADVDNEGSKQLKSDGWEYGETLLEPLYDPSQLAELLEINTFHAQCCDVVATDAGGLNWTINPVPGREGSDESKIKAEEFIMKIRHGINKVLRKRDYDRRAMGYGAIEIIREGRSRTPPVNLVHIPSHLLRRHRDGVRVVQKVGTRTVWFVIYGANRDEKGKPYDVHADTGEKHKYNSLRPEERANELLWSMDYTPKSQYYGLAKVVPAIRAIYGDTSRADYNTAFFKNYGMPAFAVTVAGDFEDYDKVPGDPDYDVTQTLKYKISQQIKEVINNPHSAITILIPSEGEEGNVEIKLQPLSIETKEASFRMYRKDNRDEVLTAHRVPGYRIGINETGALGGSNTDEATKIYKMSVVEPLQSDNEEDINWLLRDEFDITDWQFSISEIDTRDMLEDIKIAGKLFRMAAMTPRQLIEYFGERFGLKADSKNPYLDEYYINGVPLDSLYINMGVDPPGTGSVLRRLENDLSGVDGEDSDKSDGVEGRAVKDAFNRLRSRVSDAVTSRRST